MSESDTTVLAVLAHPNPESLSAALLAETRTACKEAGAQIITSDLHADGFDPVMSAGDLSASFGMSPPAEDVTRAQDAIRNADVLVLHYPVFWYQPPAILKGWLDRVFNMGFAFQSDESGTRGLLQGKRALVVQTAGAPQEAYEHADPAKYADPATSTILHSLRFCGIEAEGLTHYGALPGANPSLIESMKTRTRDAVRRVIHG